MTRAPTRTWSAVAAAAGLLVGAAAVLVFPACSPKGVFRCQNADQCGVNGLCESTGACSVKDTTCESGRRYRTYAPESLGDRCVEDACPGNPVTLVRAGGDHACLVRRDGHLSCWGQGSDGQLGNGTFVARSSIEAVAEISLPVIDVALGDRHTCVVEGDGTVWCWGANESGQLGDDSTVGRSMPAPVPGIEDAVAVVAGGGFSCALHAARTLSCWGRNASGELGQGAAGAPSLRPVAIPDLSDVDLMAAADRHVCVATRLGAISCWGSNSQGELGDGTSNDRATPTLVTAGITSAGEPATALAAGVAHTCVLAAGQVRCWGANQLGERGDGSDASDATPSVVSALTDVTDIAAAGHHTCAIESDGRAWCWGANQAGQLGEGTTTNIGVPVPVSELGDVVAVAAGETFSCARRRDGTVWCWGDDRLGQLGTGARVDRVEPTEVARSSGAVALAAGSGHTCSLSSAGLSPPLAASPPFAIDCWGANFAGQLGDGTRLDRGTAGPLKIALDAREIVAGSLHTCIAAGDGQIWCWGRGSRGQLGAGLMIDYVVPVSATGVQGVANLGAGGIHSCAVRGIGAVCWGANDDGQLGGGTFEPRSGFVTVEDVGGEIVQLALGAAHTCARRSDGRIACWGRGTEGQLGDGKWMSSAHPVEVPGVVDAVFIGSGDDHVCAVSRSGTVACWGAGTNGQLGGDDDANQATPATIVGLRDAVQITGGSRHTCARTTPDRDPATPGIVQCWGDNTQGQLGDGTRDSRRLPAVTPGLSDALGLVAGGAHTCAIRAQGKIVCWGDDTSGQLGNGRALQFATAQPARIACP